MSLIYQEGLFTLDKKPCYDHMHEHLIVRFAKFFILKEHCPVCNRAYFQYGNIAPFFNWEKVIPNKILFFWQILMSQL